MAKREVITIKEDVEIAKNVFLSKGDMIVEAGKGRWMIIEADGDEDEDKEDKKEESEDGDEDDMDDEDKEDKKDEKKKK
ncbi:MAG: hypothetical protein WC942_09510 [Clostridia bacterium]|jgi:hypothetical protein